MSDFQDVYYGYIENNNEGDMMKNYIVSDTDIFDICEKIYGEVDSNDVDNIRKLLKSKKLVELVAEVEPSDSARHLLIKSFNDIGQSRIDHKFIFKEGKYKLWISEE